MVITKINEKKIPKTAQWLRDQINKDLDTSKEEIRRNKKANEVTREVIRKRQSEMNLDDSPVARKYGLSQEDEEEE